MITVKFDEKGLFFRQMNNLVKYSVGFLDGVQKGKPIFLKAVGEGTKEILESFIDVNARVNPESLHHVYEWYQTGSPEARLFDIVCVVTSTGLSFNSTFSQSRSVREGSSEPFYDKATIMENGVPVKISPKNADRLVFDVDGRTVFTSNTVRVDEPGGGATTGGFKNVFDMFFERYFQQSFLQSANMRKMFSEVSGYSASLPAGLASGRQPGFAAGIRWISNVKVDF
jgi:hypothetical protein